MLIWVVYLSVCQSKGPRSGDISEQNENIKCDCLWLYIDEYVQSHLLILLIECEFDLLLIRRQFVDIYTLYQLVVILSTFFVLDPVPVIVISLKLCCRI